MVNNKEEEIKKIEYDIISHFDNELRLIDDSISDIELLYAETKEHYDRVKNSQSRGSLNFVERQTSNLVSLKTAKVTMIKERINIKKLQIDTFFKQEKAKGDENNNNEALVAQVAQYLMKNDTAVNDIEDDYVGDVEGTVSAGRTSDVEKSVDDLLAERIKQLQEDGQIELTDNEIATMNENKKVKIVVLRRGKSWKFGAVNEENEIIKGYPVPDKANFKIKLQKDDEGVIIAVDQDEKVYDVINI